jgi:hypothetical protein
MLLAFTPEQQGELHTLLRTHVRFPRVTEEPSLVRTPLKCITTMRHVFFAPTDTRRQWLQLDDMDILHSTSREAFFRSAARIMCRPVEPINWTAAPNGQCFFFVHEGSIFRFTLLSSTRNAARVPSVGGWHFGKVVFHDLMTSDPLGAETAAQNPPAGGDEAPVGNPAAP